MIQEELKLMLEEGETHETEFKEGMGGIDREIVAFANSSGGKILLGVKDDGTVKGVKATNKLKSQIQDTANNCEPKVEVSFDVVDGVLIVNIPEGSNKPHMCRKGFFIRLGPNSQKLSRDEILRFAIKEGRIRYDEETNPEFDFKEDFDKKRFSDFLEKAGITVNLPPESILFNMGLTEKKKDGYSAKNVVPLFFSKNTRKFNNSAYTTCILFKGNTRSHIIDRKDFDGDLVGQVEDAVRFVEKNILLTYQIKDLVRKEIPQYPLDAIREGVVNAIMHRDYLETGSNVFVYLYDDFIEIVNPGGLFGITKDQLGKICARRNERIADLFKMTGLVEKAGTGIQRMKDATRKAGLREPKIEASENFFMITFYGHKKEELEGISEGEEAIALNERQKKFVKMFEEKGGLTRADYERVTGASKRTAIRDLKDLIRKNIIIDVSKSKTDPNRRYRLA